MSGKRSPRKAGHQTKKCSNVKYTKKLTKTERILTALASGHSLNRFEATVERKPIGDEFPWIALHL